MKYHVQSRQTGKWVSAYKWVDTQWDVSWKDKREDAVLLDVTEIGWLKDGGKVNECDCFRGEERDVLAPDGVIDYGLRKVSKRGTVRFAGRVWKHEKLVPLAGKKVLVQADEYWIQHPCVYFPPDFDEKNHICDCDLEKNILKEGKHAKG